MTSTITIRLSDAVDNFLALRQSISPLPSFSLIIERNRNGNLSSLSPSSGLRRWSRSWSPTGVDYLNPPGRKGLTNELSNISPKTILIIASCQPVGAFDDALLEDTDDIAHIMENGQYRGVLLLDGVMQDEQVAMLKERLHVTEAFQGTAARQVYAAHLRAASRPTLGADVETNSCVWTGAITIRGSACLMPGFELFDPLHEQVSRRRQPHALQATHGTFVECSEQVLECSAMLHASKTLELRLGTGSDCAAAGFLHEWLSLGCAMRLVIGKAQFWCFWTKTRGEWCCRVLRLSRITPTQAKALKECSSTKDTLFPPIKLHRSIAPTILSGLPQVPVKKLSRVDGHQVSLSNARRKVAAEVTGSLHTSEQHGNSVSHQNCKQNMASEVLKRLPEIRLDSLLGAFATEPKLSEKKTRLEVEAAEASAFVAETNDCIIEIAPLDKKRHRVPAESPVKKDAYSQVPSVPDQGSRKCAEVEEISKPLCKFSDRFMAAPRKAEIFEAKPSVMRKRWRSADEDDVSNFSASTLRTTPMFFEKPTQDEQIALKRRRFERLQGKRVDIRSKSVPKDVRRQRGELHKENNRAITSKTTPNGLGGSQKSKRKRTTYIAALTKGILQPLEESSPFFDYDAIRKSSRKQFSGGKQMQEQREICKELFQDPPSDQIELPGDGMHGIEYCGENEVKDKMMMQLERYFGKLGIEYGSALGKVQLTDFIRLKEIIPLKDSTACSDRKAAGSVPRTKSLRGERVIDVCRDSSVTPPSPRLAERTDGIASTPRETANLVMGDKKDASNIADVRQKPHKAAALTKQNECNTKIGCSEADTLPATPGPIQPVLDSKSASGFLQHFRRDVELLVTEGAIDPSECCSELTKLLVAQLKLLGRRKRKEFVHRVVDTLAEG